MPDAFPRKTWRLRNLRGMPLGLLASLVVLTAAAWALTLYQTFSMDIRRGLHARLGGGGPSRVCPGPVRQRVCDEPRSASAFEMGATGARCHAWRRWTLPIHDPQAHLP